MTRAIRPLLVDAATHREVLRPTGAFLHLDQLGQREHAHVKIAESDDDRVGNDLFESEVLFRQF